MKKGNIKAEYIIIAVLTVLCCFLSVQCLTKSGDKDAVSSMNSETGTESAESESSDVETGNIETEEQNQTEEAGNTGQETVDTENTESVQPEETQAPPFEMAWTTMQVYGTSPEGTVLYSMGDSGVGKAMEESVWSGDAEAGTLKDDWDGDGKEDTLSFILTEMEGSLLIDGLHLELSGTEELFELKDPQGHFYDIFSGDFDEDGKQEVVLAFDTGYAGANGGYGMYLLDEQGGNLVSVFGEEMFTGFLGEYMTPFFALEKLEADGREYLEFRQYVFGEFTTDHLADFVVAFSVKDGEAHILSERIDADIEN